MARTTMPAGAPGSNPMIYNAALFADLWRGTGAFMDRLAGPAPTKGMVKQMLEKGRAFNQETDRGYPIVRITDLENKAGDALSVDLVHANFVLPVMGDEEVKGRRGQTTFASQDGRINAYTFGWDGGGKMAQKRTPHQLKPLARSAIVRNAREYLHQLKLVHLAGARGSHNSEGWVLPLADDPEFNKLTINPVLAPTHNRYMVAGGAADIAAMDTTCFLKLQDIARIRQADIESDKPMLPVMLPEDPAAETTPLGLLLVSDRQWYWLEQYHSGTGNDWQTFLANAHKRGARNPLFAGSGDSCGMWGGVLVMKMPRPIRFGVGDAVTVATSADVYTETTVTVPAGLNLANTGDPLDDGVDRAIYLGAQALAELWGADNATGLPTDWYEGYENDGRTPVFSLQGIGGCFKLRFRDKRGRDWDHGVTVMDSYAPSPVAVQDIAGS